MRALQAKKKQLFKRLFLFLFLSVSWCFWKRDVNWGSFNQDRNRKQGCFGKTTCRFHYLCCQVTLEIEAVDTPLFTAKRKKINKNAMSLWNKNNLTWLVTKWTKNLEFFTTMMMVLPTFMNNNTQRRNIILWCEQDRGQSYKDFHTLGAV